MIHCVTTMNKEYYDTIGIVMVNSWTQCFPDNYILHLYLEDFEIKKIKHPRIVYEDWNDVAALYKVWETNKGSSNLRHQKFTLKACSQIAAWRKIQTGKMFWLDADLLFLKPIPKDMFDDVLENYSIAAWGDQCFESGTVWFNLDHEDFAKVKDIYESIYIGDRNLPENQRWYDGELLGWSVNEAGIKIKKLQDFYNIKKSSTPLNKSPLGEYMQHFKAKRKVHLKESLIAYGRTDLAALL